VDDTTPDGALFGVAPDLGHEIVADFGLDLVCALQVDLVLVRLQIGQLLGRDQPGLVLSGSQGNPYSAPESTFVRL
jgi:hypothetical protein